MKLSKTMQIGVGAVIAAAGLWVFFRGVDTARLWQELSQGSMLAFLAVMALNLLSIWFRSMRMAVILPSPSGTHKRRLFGHVAISFMVNNIFPARAGEAARVLLLWKKNNYPPAIAIGALVLERLIDVFVFMSFFFIPVFLIPELKRFFFIASIFSGLFVVFILVLITCAMIPEFIRRQSARLTIIVPARYRERLKKALIETLSSLEWTHSIGKTFLVCALSYLTTLCYAVIMCILMADPVNFGFLKGMFSQAYGALGAAIPLSPGYIGTIHALLLQGLVELGQDREKARALAILYHGLSYIPLTLIGLFYLFKTDISLRDISRAKEDLRNV